MSQRAKVAKTLAKQMSNKPKIPAVSAVKDIEDVVENKYFSPVQTRQQRKTNNSQQNLFESDIKKLSQPSKLDKKSKVSDKDELKPHLYPGSNTQVTLEQIVPEEDSSKWEPNNWRVMLENIRKMRADSVAPVDSMGCHKCSDEAADEKTQRFQKLVALMLSSQTKDEITFAAMQRLKTHSLTPEVISVMNTNKLEEVLRPVSFYKNKAKYLQQASRVLIEKYGGDIPNTIKELVALPGVGPKMAHICMSTAWGEVTGIGVDVHVHRIANRLKWVPKPTKEPEQTRVALESWLPREMWKDVNHLLVGFGQTVCAAVHPNCAECLNRNICPSVDIKRAKKSSNINEESDEAEAVTTIKKAKFQKKKLQA